MTIQVTAELLERLDNKKKEWDARKGKKYENTVLLSVCSKCQKPSEWHTVESREATDDEIRSKKAPTGQRFSLDGTRIEWKIRHTATMVNSTAGKIHKMCQGK